MTLVPGQIFSALPNAGQQYFAVHPFIESHPDAVFIMRTNVDVKTNSEAKKQAGVDFARSVFVPATKDTPGRIPISHKIVLKPNLTLRFHWEPQYTVEDTMGIVTDAFFVEGIIETIKALGVAGEQIYLVETNYDAADLADGGYLDMVERTGVNLPDLNKNVNELEPAQIVWKDVPDGRYFRKIPYLYPVNAPDSWLLNIAKLKAHSMGLTLCAKNIQGCIAKPYQEHCRTRDEGDLPVLSPEHIVPDALAKIEADYQNHKNHIPRWDKPGNLGGLWQHLWATRCLDNNSVTRAGLCVIEGIYGRDGDFVSGPGPDGLATDYMTNIIIFGKHPFYTDIIGHWLGGHEPGNFGLFHLAIERGLAARLNPRDIPVYEWRADGSAILTPLDEFERTPLKTKYLRRDYNGQDEPFWHLCDEPYDYPTSLRQTDQSGMPTEFSLRQNYPNPFNSTTTIEYHLPQAGWARVEIFNLQGRLVAQLVDAYHYAGRYFVDWNASHYPTGMYFYRLSVGHAYRKTRTMQLIR